MIETAPKTVEQWLIIAALVSAIAVGEAAYLNRLKDILRKMKPQPSKKTPTPDNKEKQIVKAERVFRALLVGFWSFSLAAIIAFSMVIRSLGLPATLLSTSPHLIVAVLCAIGWLCLIYVAWQSYSFRDPARRKAK